MIAADFDRAHELVARVGDPVIAELLYRELCALEARACYRTANRYPALEKWRQGVLEARHRRTPLEVSAAWELTAMQCDEEGVTPAAIAAMQEALKAIGVRRAA